MKRTLKPAGAPDPVELASQHRLDPTQHHHHHHPHHHMTGMPPPEQFVQPHTLPSSIAGPPPFSPNSRKRKVSTQPPFPPGPPSHHPPAPLADMSGAGTPVTMAPLPPPQAPSHPHPPPHAQMQAPTAPVVNPAPTPPASKKSRTNTPWTPAEEQRLKVMRDGHSSWSDIAKTFPTRTEGSVKKHWYKDMHYAEFGEDESAALQAAIKDYEASKWKVIGQRVGKPAKACEQYAREHFGNS